MGRGTGLDGALPLCRHGRPPREAITHAVQAIERKVSAAGPRADALALLEIFGGLAFPRLDVERIIGSEKMIESKMLRRIRQEGELLRQRANILRVLRTRFGAGADAEFTATLDAIDDMAQLEPLLDRAVTCRNLNEFRAALPARGATT